MIHFNTVFKVMKLLPRRQRVKFIFVLLFGVLLALVEILGVGSAAPFLAVASYPETIHKNFYLSKIYNFLGFSSDKNFIIFLGSAVLILIILTNIFKGFNKLFAVRFASRCKHFLSSKLMDGYLKQKYSFFLYRNTHELLVNINGEIRTIIEMVLYPFIEFTASVVQIIFFSIFLFIINPFVSLFVFIGLALAYIFIYGILRSRLKFLGSQRYRMEHEKGRIVSEAFWGIKDVKLAGKEYVFSEQFALPSSKAASIESKSEALTDVPKYALETVASSIILIYVIYIIVSSNDFLGVSVTAALFAYAGYRMIPSSQLLFRSTTKMKFGSAAVAKVMSEFATVKDADLLFLEPVASRLPFEKNICIDNISFKYPSIDRKVIDRVFININRNEMIGIMGTTGSGKTTLIDIICGFLEPVSGFIKIDGVVIDAANVRAWQANIGYVPQSIYLSNSSIAQNIAFGEPESKIDMDRVIEVAKMAQIHDFIDMSLPEKYNSYIGERGICLSGGQRQRLGIARALYSNPEVLIFDEATSALDNKTEAELMSAIENISGKLTIVMIAHRLTTLKNCNKIYHIENGRITEEGTYDELVGKHSHV